MLVVNHSAALGHTHPHTDTRTVTLPRLYASVHRDRTVQDWTVQGNQSSAKLFIINLKLTMRASLIDGIRVRLGRQNERERGRERGTERWRDRQHGNGPNAALFQHLPGRAHHFNELISLYLTLQPQSQSPLFSLRLSFSIRLSPSILLSSSCFLCLLPLVMRTCYTNCKASLLPAFLSFFAVNYD